MAAAARMKELAHSELTAHEALLKKDEEIRLMSYQGLFYIINYCIMILLHYRNSVIKSSLCQLIN